MTRKLWPLFLVLCMPHVSLSSMQSEALWCLAEAVEHPLDILASQDGSSQGRKTSKSTPTLRRDLKSVVATASTGEEESTTAVDREAGSKVSWRSFVHAAGELGVFADDWSTMPEWDPELVLSGVSLSSFSPSLHNP